MTKDEELSRLRLELMHYSEHMERKVCELNNIIKAKSELKSCDSCIKYNTDGVFLYDCFTCSQYYADQYQPKE